MNEIFARQISLPQIGESGQTKLEEAKVLVCGVGGLGCPCAVYLASMGIGTITLCDGDTVQKSNLNRQFLFTERHVGMNKAKAAAEVLQAQFPHTRFIAKDTFLTVENANELVKSHTCVADCLDTWEDRLTLNDACLQENTPFIHAAVSGFCGQIIPVIPHKTACLRCLQTTPVSDPSVLGAAAGAIACLQAAQICLLITQNNTANGIFMLDMTTLESVSLPMSKNSDCICNRI